LTVTRARLDDGAPPRVAYAVGRHVGSAVTRNRVRRRLRAAVREEAAGLESSCAYLIGVGPGAAVASYGDLRGTLRAILADMSSEVGR
jgi:ribonuclease P protein component